MSGTSLDGLDIALCAIKGTGRETAVTTTKFVTKSYSSAEKNELKKISSVETVDLRDLCYIHTWLAHLHANMINDALKEWNVDPSEVDCIASHGQTIYHYPARDQQDKKHPLNSTLQIGDGDHIALKTGVLTLSDFRQKHTALGGEGAPMAALVDRILFGSETEDRVLLNVGGIANYTWLPAGKRGPREAFTTDTGPGNTLIDNTVQHFFGQSFDNGGRIAASGTVQNELLNQLMRDSWFHELKSKSTGPEYFNLQWVERKLKSMGRDLESVRPEDLIATITELSAATIAENMADHLPQMDNYTIYTSGGGAHNTELMRRLQIRLPDAEMNNIAELGIDPDAKEAVVFAVLANETLAGDGFQLSEEPVSKEINFGKISLPG